MLLEQVHPSAHGLVVTPDFPKLLCHLLGPLLDAQQVLRGRCLRVSLGLWEGQASSSHLLLQEGWGQNGSGQLVLVLSLTALQAEKPRSLPEPLD